MCAQTYDDERLFKVNVSRLDWASLRDDTVPSNHSLFKMFTQDQQQRLNLLDTFFGQHGYSSKARTDRVHNWDLKYQGNRIKKGSPLFQIDYDERYHDPLRLVETKQKYAGIQSLILRA